MKTKNEFETTYAKVLKECVALLNQESNYEKEKIALAFEIGKKVDELVNLSPDKESIIRRLSRDIFKERGKVISPSKIAEYQQLYLSFGSIGMVNNISKGLLNDMTTELLTKLATKQEDPKGNSKENSDAFVSILQKINRLLNKAELLAEEHQPAIEKISEILENLESIRDKIDSILKAAQSDGKRSQLGLFISNVNYKISSSAPSTIDA